MKKSLLICSAAFAVLSGALAQAQDVESNESSVVEDETVALTGTRLPVVDVVGYQGTALRYAPETITVIDQAALDIRSSPFLADQLRAVPGASISRSGAKGGLTQVRLRGAEANHTLVTLNGIEISDPITGETDFGLLGGLQVRQIEVARGEQSAKYGSDAIGGVVNIETRAPYSYSDHPFTGLAELGSENTTRFEAGYMLETDDTQIDFALSDFRTSGVDTAGLDGEKDGSHASSAIATGYIYLPSDWDLRFLARYAESTVETDPDSDFDGRLDNADRETDTTQATLGASLSGEAMALNHMLSISYNDVTRENFGDGNSLNESEGRRTKLSYSPSYSFDLGDGFYTLSALIDYEIEDYKARDTEFGGFTNQDQSFNSLGLGGEVFAQYDNLNIRASARHDNNDGQFDDATVWRVGAVYEFDSGLRVRGGLGTGVKNPTFTELFGFFPGSFIGNANLEPERSSSWEAGMSYDVYDFYDGLDVGITYFEADLENEIFTRFNPNFTSTPDNRAGESERSGIEAFANLIVNDSLSVSASATNIQSSNESGANEIRVPEWTGSFNLDWRAQDFGSFWEGARAGLAIDYVGEQLDTDFGTFQTVELDPYWLISATAEYPITERLAITLRGENLLDETVTDVFGFNGPGAGLFVGLKLRTE